MGLVKVRAAMSTLGERYQERVEVFGSPMLLRFPLGHVLSGLVLS